MDYSLIEFQIDNSIINLEEHVFLIGSIGNGKTKFLINFKNFINKIYNWANNLDDNNIIYDSMLKIKCDNDYYLIKYDNNKLSINDSSTNKSLKELFKNINEKS